MKTQNYLLLVILFQLCLTSTIKKYKLEIKDGNGEENQITLIPGIFTKITLSLTNLEGNEFAYKDETKYIIKFNDEKIVASKAELILNPQESMVYTNYIGISCTNLIEGETHSLSFKVEKGNDSTDENSLEYEPVTLKINKAQSEIKLDLLLKSMVKQTKNFFKLENEIYNVDDINITLDETSSALAKFDFKSLVIAAFNKRNEEEISQKSAENHGILFNYPLFSKDIVEQSQFNFKLKFDSNSIGTCFKLAKTDFDFQIKTEGAINLDANVKSAILYNIEDGSPKYDATNKIQINTIIPVAPVILDCEFSMNSTISNEGTSKLKSTIEEGTKFFKTVVTSTGKISIVVDNLNATADYKAKCEISTTDAFDEAIKKIEVTIGNYINADIIKKLVPSKDPNATPQCVKFTFENLAQSVGFSVFGPLFCRYFMKKNDALIARALPSVICDSLLPNNENVTLCVAPSPLYNTAKVLSKKTETDFNKRFDEFVEEIRNIDLTKYNISSISLKVSNIEREKDIPINPSSVSVALTEIKKDLFNFTPIEFLFNVHSSHSQNLECFYNLFLTNEEPSLINYFEGYVILEPNTNQILSVKPRLNFLFGDDKYYSFNLRCRNLPGFLFKYETTGNMNKYTYLNTKTDINQIIERISEITINCNEKKNKLNPRCIHEKIVSIADQLKTEIPKKISEIESEIQQFANTAREVKKHILNQLKTDFEALVKKADTSINQLVEEAIKILRYLSYTDCSIYVSGSKNSEAETFKYGIYVECRETKQNIIERIIEALKDKFQCPAVVSFISNFSDDYEQNLKYLLFLVNELSNNPESFKNETTQFLIDLAECLHDNFDKYWKDVEKYLKEKKSYLEESIKAVKRDVEHLILQTLENLAEVLHFNELDGLIANITDQVTKTGLIVYDKAKEIQNKIIEFAKRLNEFGAGNYTFNGEMSANVDINDGQISAETESEIKVNYVTDKNIVILTHSNLMLKKYNAYALQTLVFESPLVSVKATAGLEGNYSEAVNTFVSITLYDKDGKEITAKEIEDKIRPKILYLKEKYDQLKSCYYYDEIKKDLNNKGVSLETLIFEGKEYISCVSNHLTSFTAGTKIIESESESDINPENPEVKKEGLSTGIIILIILGVILLLAVLVAVVIMIKKKSATSNGNIDQAFNQNEGLVDMN